MHHAIYIPCISSVVLYTEQAAYKLHFISEMRWMMECFIKKAVNYMQVIYLQKL